MNTYVDMQAPELTEKSLADYWDVLRRRRKVILTTGSAVLIVALLLALGLPPVYRSKAVILIEQQEIPAELVRSTVTSYADQRIQSISQLVMTTSNLGEIVNKYDLYADERKRYPAEVVLGEMREDIAIDTISADVVDPRSGQPRKATIAFTLSYDSRSPQLSQKVTNEIVSLFLNANLKDRTESATEAATFLQDEAKRINAQLGEMEKKLAEFKERNAGALPENVPINMQLMERASQERSEIERQVNALQERRAYLEAELMRTGPLSPLSTETGERVLGPGDRLRILQSEFATLTARYGAAHPDVVRTKRAIEALRKEVGTGTAHEEIQKQLEGKRGELAEARERYGAGHPEVVRLEAEIKNLEREMTAARVNPGSVPRATQPDNPAFIQLSANLQAIQTELASYAAKRQELAAIIADFERKLAAAPQVEREYRALSRDYDSAALKFQEINAKLMEAQVSQTLETERMGERFTLIEPPLLPEKAEKPNRLAILLLGLVLAIGSAIGAAAVMESVDQTIRGRRMLAELVGAAPLAVIPYITTAADVKAQAKPKVYLLAGALIALTVALIAFHIIVMPLDVLWFVLLRRFGV